MRIQRFETWFLADVESSCAGVPIYCFPHAGGNPRTFLRWQSRLGLAAQLLAVVPPGRGHRGGESFVRSVDDYADQAAEAVLARGDRRLVLFGHSLGALIAFEVARRLRGVDLVVDLVASGCAAPSLLPSPRVVAIARLEGRAFAEAAAYFGGLPPEVIDDEEVRGFFLPPLQADLRLVAGYRYHAEPRLRAHVNLVNGTDDPHVHAEALGAWSQECQDAPNQLEAPGGHFYFERDPTVLTSLLLDLATRDAASVGQSASQHAELI